jgi:inorganic triphosphatase YgiF
VVEVALDIGQVEASGRQASICELELELKVGTPDALFALARLLGHGAALLPANRSKAERGFLLAQDALSRPQRARLAPLVLPLSGFELAQHVLRDMFAQFSQNLELLGTSDDPEVVHQARVGWRRFRSGLRLFGKTLAGFSPPSLLELQPLLVGLGALRDLDVAVTETLPALADGFVAGQAGRAQAWQAVLADLTQAANAQRQQLRQTLQVPAVGLCLLALTEWLENLTRSDPDGPLQKGALRRWARRRVGRLQQRLVQAQESTDSPQQQHRVRILAKRLRYGVEALRELLPRKLADAYGAQASLLQSSLGWSRDVAQAGALVARLDADPVIEAYLRGVVVGFRAGLVTAP